jgi:hypothetical protein
MHERVAATCFLFTVPSFKEFTKAGIEAMN